MQEGRGLGNKRVNRIGVNLTNETTIKLSKLATATGMPKSTLAAHLIERCLDDPALVLKLQEEYGKYEAYKVLPVNVNGKIKYMLRG